MLDALDLYRRMVNIQIRSQLQYRAAFLLEVFGTGLSTGVWFLGLALLFQRFDRLGGWSFGEVALLYGTVEVAFGLMDLLFSGYDPQDFGQQVRRGTFDQVLLRPVSLPLQVLGSRFAIRRLGRITEGAAILALALALAGVQWTPLKAAVLVMAIVSLIGFFGGLFIIGATITFWTVESIEVVNIFTYGGAEMMSYPFHIYPDVLRRFFTYVVPAIFLNYYPALVILNKPDPLGLPSWAPLLSPAVGLGTLVAALWFWRFGVRHYQSTGT